MGPGFLRRLKGTFVEIRKGGRRVRKAHTKQGQGLCPCPCFGLAGLRPAKRRRQPSSLRGASEKPCAARVSLQLCPAVRHEQAKAAKFEKVSWGRFFDTQKPGCAGLFLYPGPTPRLFAAQGGNFLVCNIARIRAHTAAGVSLQTAKKGPFRCFLAYESPAKSGAFQLNPDGAKGVHSPCLPARKPPPYPPPAGEGSPLPAGR